MLSEPGNSRRRIRRACTRTCCIVNLLQQRDNGRLALGVLPDKPLTHKWIKSIISKRNAADMELKVHFFKNQDIGHIKFSPLSWDLTIWLDLLWNVLSRGAWWWSQGRPRVWARPSQRGSCRTGPGWRSPTSPPSWLLSPSWSSSLASWLSSPSWSSYPPSRSTHQSSNYLTSGKVSEVRLSLFFRCVSLIYKSQWDLLQRQSFRSFFECNEYNSSESLILGENFLNPI